MTDKERLSMLNIAMDELKRTDIGYPEKLISGSHWAKAMNRLNKLAADLKPDLIVLPPLGPVYIGGKSVLYQDLTHSTAGIPLYPAFDDGWVAGRVVIAPEDMAVIAPKTSSDPGQAMYCQGESHLRYWFGHLDRSHAVGTKLQKGAALGKIMYQPHGKSHVHVGVNIELLPGCNNKELLHHNDYSHGAPEVGIQLKKILQGGV